MRPDLTATHYRVISHLGKGTFSQVFTAAHRHTGEEVAVKWAPNATDAYLLEREINVLRDLNRCKHVPKLLSESRKERYVIMEKVGKTLLEWKERLGSLSLQTVLLLGIRCLSAFEEIHACGYIHRDVKPDNIATTLDESSTRIFLIDFGLSIKYISRGLHVLYAESHDFNGSPYFCSLNSIKGVKCSRRDDIESLLYILIYLKGGYLPWLRIPKEKHYEICRLRDKISIKDLCISEDPVFDEYLTYCRALKFDEKPNYDYLKSLFQFALRRYCLDLNSVRFDWNATKPKSGHESKRNSAKSPSKRHQSMRIPAKNRTETRDLPVEAQLPRRIKTRELLSKTQSITLDVTQRLRELSKSTAVESNSEDEGESEVLTPKVSIRNLPSFRVHPRRDLGRLLKTG